MSYKEKLTELDNNFRKECIESIQSHFENRMIIDIHFYADMFDGTEIEIIQVCKNEIYFRWHYVQYCRNWDYLTTQSLANLADYLIQLQII